MGNNGQMRIPFSDVSSKRLLYFEVYRVCAWGNPHFGNYGAYRGSVNTTELKLTVND